MEFFNSALGRNITFVRPAYFIIGGLIGIPHVKYYYGFLFFIYFVTVLGNTIVIILIYLDNSLRAPKYIAIFNLAIVDVFTVSALVPKVLDIFLFNHPYIPYNDCLTFLFFSFISLSMQALTLVALSCDRVIAIIFPLHYQMKVTNRTMLSLIAFFWLFTVTRTLIAVGLLTRLSFCNSVVINSYFCDHNAIYRLGCNDITPSRVMAGLSLSLVLWFPLIFILTSYCGIFYALSKICTVKGKVKAFKTCTGHLSLVAVYFLPVTFAYLFGGRIHPNTRIIVLSLTAVIPPLLNPVIYVLQTQEIKESLKRLLKIRGQSKFERKT